MHAYQPDIGALGTRSNLASLTDPAAICAMLDPSLVPGVPTRSRARSGRSPDAQVDVQEGARQDLPSQLTGLLGLPGKLVGGQLGKAITA